MEQIDKEIADNLMSALILISFAGFMPINLDKFKNNHLEVSAYILKDTKREFYIKMKTILDKKVLFDFFIECGFTHLNKPHIMFCTTKNLIDKTAVILRYFRRVMKYGS